MNPIIIKKDELCHYGIKGQKYGVRRFQNADGSLTDAGRSRYGVFLNNVNKTDMETLKKNNPEAYAKLYGNSENSKTDNKEKTNSGVSSNKTDKATTKELEPDDLKKIFGSDFDVMKAKVAEALAAKGPGAKELTPEEVKEILGGNFETIKKKVDTRLSEKAKEVDEASKEKKSSSKKTSRKKSSSKKNTTKKDDSTKKNTTVTKKTDYEKAKEKTKALEKEEDSKWKISERTNSSYANQEHRIAMAKLQNARKEEDKLKKKQAKRVIKHSAIMFVNNYNGASYRVSIQKGGK